MRYILVLSTASSMSEAAKIGKALVSKKLIACMNIVPGARSIYEWKGRLYDSKEVVMMMKSRRSLLPKLKKELKKLHSYECPELVSLPIDDGLPAYLEWVFKNTK